jgi:hypothetical protein
MKFQLPARRRDANFDCARCGKRVPRKARCQRFCSRKCRQRSHYDKSVAEGRFDPLLGRDSGRPTHPLRSPLNGNGFSEQKSGLTVGISGPFVVIEAEIMGRRPWREAISADGVQTQVCQLVPSVRTR